MQSVSSRIWTRVAETISYDDSNYTTDTVTHNGVPANKICSYFSTNKPYKKKVEKSFKNCFT